MKRLAALVAVLALALVGCSAQQDEVSAPESCLVALDAAEQVMGLQYEANEIVINWIGETPEQYELDAMENVVDRVGPIVDEFNSAKADCRNQ